MPGPGRCSLRLLPQPHPHGRAHDYRMLEQVVRQAFGQRRKTLRNAVAGLLDAATLERLGIDPGRRPETLTVGEFVALSNAVAPQPGAGA